MTQGHKIELTVIIRTPREANDLTVSATKWLTFVPWEGLTIRISDGDYSAEITLEGLGFDVAKGQFYCMVDETCVMDAIRNGDDPTEAARDALNTYCSAGFRRTKFPQFTARAHEVDEE